MILIISKVLILLFSSALSIYKRTTLPLKSKWIASSYYSTRAIALVLAVMVSSCVKKSEIKPAFETITIKEQIESQRSDSFSDTLKASDTSKEKLHGVTSTITYIFKGQDLAELTDEGDRKKSFFEKMGDSISITLAKSLMGLGAEFDIKLDGITYELPEVDRELIQSIKIKSIRIYANEKSKKAGATLKFLKEFKLTANSISMNKEMNIVNYNQDRNGQPNGDILLDIKSGNLLDLLDGDQAVEVTPSMKVGGIPKSFLVLDGEIEFEIVMNLPF